MWKLKLREWLARGDLSAPITLTDLPPPPATDAAAAEGPVSSPAEAAEASDSETAADRKKKATPRPPIIRV